MNEFFIKNRLHDYVDSALSAETKSEIDQAIIDHPELLKELEQMQEQRSMMLDHGQTQAPSHMLENIWAQLESEPIPAANQSPSTNSLWIWSGAIAVVMLAWWLIPHNPLPTESSEPLVKGAQSIPILNPVQLPTTSPIEQSQKQHSTDVEPVVPIDDIPEIIEIEENSLQQKTPKRPTNVKSQTFVIQTPDAPYFAEYEQDVHIIEIEGEHPEHDESYFAFSFAPSNILHQLNALAIAHNGLLLSMDGDQLTPYNLSATTPIASVELHIPVSKVSKANDELRQLGGRFSGETIDEINGYGVFKIQLNHQNY